jgi:hypothetical protein
MTLTDFYERDIKILPPTQRLKLASLILNDMTTPGASKNEEDEIDVSDEWGDSDYEEFSRTSWQHVESQTRAEPRDG